MSTHQVVRSIELALNGYILVAVSLLGYDVNTDIMTFGIRPFIPEPNIRKACFVGRVSLEVTLHQHLKTMAFIGFGEVSSCRADVIKDSAKGSCGAESKIGYSITPPYKCFIINALHNLENLLLDFDYSTICIS